MLVETEGYLSLIAYLADKLDLFESHQPGDGEQTIEEIVSSRIANNLMAICKQHPQLDQKVRFVIMQEADAVVADLEELLSAIWRQAPTPEQQAFLEEFIDLVKNVLDSVIASSPIPSGITQE